MMIEKENPYLYCLFIAKGCIKVTVFVKYVHE